MNKRFFMNAILLLAAFTLSSCSATATAGLSSEDDNEQPECTLSAKIDERVEDYGGNFYVIRSVTVKGDVVSCAGTFGIAGLRRDSFYGFITFNGLYEYAYDTYDPLIRAQTRFEASSLPDGETVSLSGETAVSFAFDDYLIGNFESRDDICIRMALGVHGKGSDQPSLLSVGRADVSFL